MSDRETVLTWLEICGKNNDCSGCCPYSENGFGEYGQCRESLMADAYDMLKDQETVQPKTMPEELKQKMWNALYAEEDKFEEKYVGTKEHDNWFIIYRPWLQEGFNLAIKAIADWEGR